MEIKCITPHTCVCAQEVAETAYRLIRKDLLPVCPGGGHGVSARVTSHTCCSKLKCMQTQSMPSRHAS